MSPTFNFGSSLWHAEFAKGQDEGIKNRPCAIMLATDDHEGDMIVTVVPITHRLPEHAEDAVELPLATKPRLGLDDERSWIVATEINRFVSGPAAICGPWRANERIASIMAFCRRICSSRSR